MVVIKRKCIVIFERSFTINLVFVLTLLIALPSYSTPPATTTFQVTATVLKVCTVTASGPVAFGNYSGNEIKNGASTVNVTCTNTTPYNIGLNAGVNGSGVTNRQMKNGTSTLNYSLFRDGAYSQNWGNTVGTDTVAATGTGLQQSFPIYAQLPASQLSTPGAYTDTITVTVTY